MLHRCLVQAPSCLRLARIRTFVSRHRFSFPLGVGSAASGLTEATRLTSSSLHSSPRMLSNDPSKRTGIGGGQEGRNNRGCDTVDGKRAKALSSDSFTSRLVRMHEQHAPEASTRSLSMTNGSEPRMTLSTEKMDRLRAEFFKEMSSLQVTELAQDPEMEAQMQCFVEDVLIGREGLNEMEVSFFMHTLEISGKIDPETGVVLSVSTVERQQAKKEELEAMNEESDPLKTKELDEETAMQVLLSRGLSSDQIQSLGKLRNLLGEDEFDDAELQRQQVRHVKNKSTDKEGK